MKQKPIKGLEKYSKQWVALDKNKSKIIAHGKSFEEVYENVDKKKVIFMAVPPLIPYCP